MTGNEKLSLEMNAKPASKEDADASRSERELLARCRANESTAWDELFDRFYPVAARFVFQLSDDFTHEDTEEICQDVFLSVVRNLASFQGKSAFQTWLLRIAANKAMDFREKSRAAKRGGGRVSLSLDGQSNGAQPAIDPPTPRPGPAEQLLQAESSLLVRQSLDQLSHACREIIELRYYGDLRYDEIALELGLNPKTVSSRLSKCLARLAQIVKEVIPSLEIFAV